MREMQRTPSGVLITLRSMVPKSRSSLLTDRERVLLGMSALAVVVAVTGLGIAHQVGGGQVVVLVVLVLVLVAIPAADAMPVASLDILPVIVATGPRPGEVPVDLVLAVLLAGRDVAAAAVTAVPVVRDLAALVVIVARAVVRLLAARVLSVLQSRMIAMVAPPRAPSTGLLVLRK